MNIIALEGIDGCGKTTMIPLVKNWLEELGYVVETVVEPQNELIRQIMSENGDNGWAGAALFAADRMITAANVNRDCDFILMDRSILSSIVYQKAQRIPVEYILEINNYDAILVPELFIYIFKPNFDESPDYISSDITQLVVDNYSEMARGIDEIETVTFHEGQPMRTFDEIKEVITNRFLTEQYCVS